MARGDGNVRIGTTEREQAVRALAEHLTEGRLDIAEYDQRCALAASAKTRGELAAIFDDLPDPNPMLLPRPAPVPVAVPAYPLIEKKPRSRTTVVVVTFLLTAIAAIVTVTAILGEWWALIPALLIVAVLAMVS
jgi:fatty acid desaturase